MGYTTVKTIRVDNATTVFGQVQPVGTGVFDEATEKEYRLTDAAGVSDTITTLIAAGKIQEVERSAEYRGQVITTSSIPSNLQNGDWVIATSAGAVVYTNFDGVTASPNDRIRYSADTSSWAVEPDSDSGVYVATTDIDANGNKIINLPTTEVDTEAANLAAVKQQLVYSGAIIYRKNKAIYYNPTTGQLSILGSEDGTSLLDVLNFSYNNILYSIKGAIGTIATLTLTASNAQIGFLSTVADPTNVQLSDFVIYNDTSVHADFIKLAHITYKEAITSSIIRDYRHIPAYPSDITALSEEIEETEAKLITGDVIRIRKRKFIAWDRTEKQLIIVGSEGSVPTDLEIIHFTYEGVIYYIKGAVGTTATLTATAGNVQIGFLSTVADPTNVQLSDFVVYNDASVHANFIKLAHLTYNEGLTSNIIIDYEDYFNASDLASVTNTLVPLANIANTITPSSFINNSIGESNFEAGLRTDLKILAFGNSFMRNSIYHLSSIAANGVGVNLKLGNLYTGGTHLDDHYNALVNDSAVYSWFKYENGVNTETIASQTAKTGLLKDRWDVIILHQYQPWSNSFDPYLQLLMLKIIEILGYCPKFYLNATWATHQDYVLAQTGFATELAQWEYEMSANIEACSNNGIIPYSIIPTGTAIQNARTLAYADSYNRFTNAVDDWHHLNSAGGFIAACAIYEKIIYPLNKIHCSETTFRINTEIALPPIAQSDAGILVTDANYLSMCQSAIDAVATPYSVTSQI